MKYFRKPNYYIPGVVIFTQFIFITVLPGTLLQICSLGWFRYWELVVDFANYLTDKDINHEEHSSN